MKCQSCQKRVASESVWDDGLHMDIFVCAECEADLYADITPEQERAIERTAELSAELCASESWYM